MAENPVDPAKILVVDDSPTDLRLVAAPLRQSGYLVVTAADGEEALAAAVREQPRVVVLDVVLPKKNGFQVCRLLKTAPDTCDIKILLLTSKNQESDRYWGLRQGADDYMTKPFADEDLLASVARLL
jgi:DNA-binding response OmpR family regulator